MMKVQLSIFITLMLFMCQSVLAQDVTREEFQASMKENREKSEKILALQNEIADKSDSIKLFQTEIEQAEESLSFISSHLEDLRAFERNSAEKLLSNKSYLLQSSLDKMTYDELKMLSQECVRYSIPEVIAFKDSLDVLSEIKLVYDEMKSLCETKFDVSEFIRLNEVYSDLDLDYLTSGQTASILEKKAIMDNSINAVLELHVMMQNVVSFIEMYSKTSHSTAWDMIKGEFGAASKNFISQVPSLNRIADRLYDDLSKNVFAESEAFEMISALYDECVTKKLFDL